MAGPVPYSEIKSFLATRFGGVYPVVDFDELEDAQAQQDNAFLVLEEIVADEETVGFGDPNEICVQETGVIMIHCFSPAPEASGATRQIAEAVRDALRFQIINGVYITDPGAPDPGMALNDGRWSDAALPVSYSWDTHKARSV